MSRKSSGILLFIAVAGCSLPVAGQAGRDRKTTATTDHAAHLARLPYTAEYKITKVKTLADGGTITRESTEVEAIDSEGRRATSTTTVPLSGDQTPRTLVHVFDPIARSNSNWSIPGDQATVMMMPAAGAAHSSCPSSTPRVTSAPASPERVAPTEEDLGLETIQGIEAHGRRTTTTTPAGVAGNDEPLVRVSELWIAVEPGLRGLVARQVTDDPQTGKMTKELVNFSQSEPDSSVFQPPSGYEVVSKETPVPSCAGPLVTTAPAAEAAQ